MLLARRGIEVTGVDINADALDFARDLLAEEPDEVRERVELVHSTAEEAGLSPGSFDTVVIGETLEHVHDPAALLDGSLGPLREGAGSSSQRRSATTRTRTITRRSACQTSST